MYNLWVLSTPKRAPNNPFPLFWWEFSDFSGDGRLRVRPVIYWREIRNVSSRGEKMRIFFTEIYTAKGEFATRYFAYAYFFVFEGKRRKKNASVMKMARWTCVTAARCDSFFIFFSVGKNKCPHVYNYSNCFAFNYRGASPNELIWFEKNVREYK